MKKLIILFILIINHNSYTQNYIPFPKLLNGEGEFINGQKEGKWTYYDFDYNSPVNDFPDCFEDEDRCNDSGCPGDVFYEPCSEPEPNMISAEINYIKGKKEGIATYYSSYGIKARGNYKNDKRDGKWFISEYVSPMNPNNLAGFTIGDFLVYVNYKEGLKHGDAVFTRPVYDFNDNDNPVIDSIRFIGQYKNNRKHGKWSMSNPILSGGSWFKNLDSYYFEDYLDFKDYYDKWTYTEEYNDNKIISTLFLPSGKPIAKREINNYYDYSILGYWNNWYWNNVLLDDYGDTIISPINDITNIIIYEYDTVSGKTIYYNKSFYDSKLNRIQQIFKYSPSGNLISKKLEYDVRLGGFERKIEHYDKSGNIIAFEYFGSYLSEKPNWWDENNQKLWFYEDYSDYDYCVEDEDGCNDSGCPGDIFYEPCDTTPDINYYYGEYSEKLSKKDLESILKNPYSIEKYMLPKKNILNIIDEF